MTRQWGYGLALTAAMTLSLTPAVQATSCVEDAMLVFDASGSMAEMGYNGLDHPRIIDARDAMHRALPDITILRRVGLVTYGPGGSDDTCSHVALRLSPSPNAADRILREIDGIEPDGSTALTRAVSLAATELGAPAERGIVVLVTDGKETCGGSPCALASDLAAEAPGLTVHVIGFRVRPDFFAWEGGDSNPNFDTPVSPAQCLAQQTGGMYVSTETVEELVDALHQTLGCPLYSALDLVPTRP